MATNICRTTCELADVVFWALENHDATSETVISWGRPVPGLPGRRTDRQSQGTADAYEKLAAAPFGMRGVVEVGEIRGRLL